MLITCPECNGNVSDKAFDCPHCGYPLKKEKRRSRPPSRIKLPNGYGSIRKLAGNRRNPYAVYPPVTDYKDNGTAILPRPIGYYPTRTEAMEALTEYNKSPYDIDARSITLGELVDKFFNEVNLNEGTRKNYSVNIRKFKPLYDKRVADLRTNDYQAIIDGLSDKLKKKTLQLVVSSIAKIVDYGVQLDIVQKNYAKFVTIKKEDDSERGIIFSEDNIKLLWKNKKKEYVPLILFQIYTGLRISEIYVVEINTDEWYIKGGLKTANGKNRIVPIIDELKPLMPRIQELRERTWVSYSRNFAKTLTELNMFEVENTHHTPHDCRHTFSWLCDKYGVDSTAKHKLMGHRVNDVEIDIYGHRTIEELRREISKIRV